MDGEFFACLVGEWNDVVSFEIDFELFLIRFSDNDLNEILEDLMEVFPFFKNIRIQIHLI